MWGILPFLMKKKVNTGQSIYFFEQKIKISKQDQNLIMKFRRQLSHSIYGEGIERKWWINDMFDLNWDWICSSNTTTKFLL